MCPGQDLPGGGLTAERAPGNLTPLALTRLKTHFLQPFKKSRSYLVERVEWLQWLLSVYDTVEIE